MDAESLQYHSNSKIWILCGTEQNRNIYTEEIGEVVSTVPVQCPSVW
jgi:hypothetical protein